jgi:hypothetical protein
MMMASMVDIYGAKNPRELPLYTVAEAARVVRMNVTTLRSWVAGRSYNTQDGRKTWPPWIHPADPKFGRLSFANLVELHVLSTERDKRVRVDRTRSATRFIRERMKTDHPLADVDTHRDAPLTPGRKALPACRSARNVRAARGSASGGPRRTR